MIEPTDSEIDQVLRELFPRAGPKKKATLGELPNDLSDPSGLDHEPGTAVSGSWGLQEEGLTGKESVARAGFSRESVYFGGLDKSSCPPWLNDTCLEVISRMMEQTFRNFNLHASRPAFIDPPLGSHPIDQYTSDIGVSIPGGGYSAGTWTTVVSQQLEDDKRGVIQGLAQGLEAGTAWNDVAWRITIDGIPISFYNNIRMQIFPTVITGMNIWIPLRQSQFIAFQAASLSATTHTAVARMFGWQYPVRSEQGDNIRSTIVD